MFSLCLSTVDVWYPFFESFAVICSVPRVLACGTIMIRYDTIRYIYVRSKTDGMASTARHQKRKNKEKLKTKNEYLRGNRPGETTAWNV